MPVLATVQPALLKTSDHRAGACDSFFSLSSASSLKEVSLPPIEDLTIRSIRGNVDFKILRVGMETFHLGIFGGFGDLCHSSIELLSRFIFRMTRIG